MINKCTCGSGDSAINHGTSCPLFKAYKSDEEKPRYNLIPPDALELLAKVLTFGARKYHPWNWAKGFDWSRPYDAAQRHLNAWWNGENNDPETGLSHLGHALCCVAFLAVHEIRGLGKDDRPDWPKCARPKPKIEVPDSEREFLDRQYRILECPHGGCARCRTGVKVADNEHGIFMIDADDVGNTRGYYVCQKHRTEGCPECYPKAIP